MVLSNMFWLFEDVRLTLYEIVKEQKIVSDSQVFVDLSGLEPLTS